MANAIHLLGNRFLIPLLVLTVTKEYGLSQNSFQYLGLLISFAVLITLIGNKYQRNELPDRELMNYGYITATVGWLIISGSMYLISLEGTPIHILATFSLLGMLVMQIASMLWTAGFFGNLKSCIKRSVDDSAKQSQIYKQITEKVILLANIGGAALFSIMFFSYNLANMHIVVFVLTLISLFIAIYSNRAINTHGKNETT